MNTTLQAMNFSLPMGSLDSYIAIVNKVPVLSREQELNLTSEYYHKDNLAAARQLVLAHLRYVVRIARSYKGYGLALGDLIQEGNIGLMKAVKRFNPEIGVRLISFAVHWIKAEIQEFILRNWRIVKVATTKTQRKLFFNLRKAKKTLSWFTHHQINEVATNLNVEPNSIREMEMRLSSNDISFDLANDEDANDNSHMAIAPAYYLEDCRYDPAFLLEHCNSQENNQQKLQHALETLDKRSQDIINQRWLAQPKKTLQDLAKHYQVSAERVRQLEQNAIKRLRNVMANPA